MEKTYRPKSGAKNLTLSFPVGGRYESVSEWPYTTDSREAQAFLDAHDSVTDRPANSAKPRDGEQKPAAKTKKKEGDS